MSWLMRTGNGRNNIAWGGGSTTKGNYTADLNDYMDGTYYWIIVDTSTAYNQSYNGNYYHRVAFG